MASSIIKLAQTMTGITVVGGVAMAANAPQTQIAQVQQSMIQKELLPQASTPPGNVSHASLDLLSALNVSVDHTTDRMFSLLGTETDTEVIENPNIIDTIQWEEVTNTNMLTTTSFPSVSDNFFTLDAGLDQAVQRQRDQIEETQDSADLTNIVVNLINYNLMDSSRPTLPQFKITS